MGQGGRRAAQASGLLREARDARAWAGARETGPWDAGSERACCGVRLGRVGSGREEWAGAGLIAGFWAGFWVFFFLLFSFLNLIQTKFEFELNLNSNHTQIKLCTSMNATKIFKPMINFN